MKIFANHAHTFPKEQRPDGTIEELMRLLDECEIDKAVCFAPFQQRFKESGIRGSSVDWLYNQIEGNDRLVGFGTLDFERSDMEKQVEHIAELGFKGIKIHPAHQEQNVMSEKLCSAYAAAEELGLFLSFHTGLHWHRIADYNMLLFDEVAWHYPKLRFSLEHMGGFSFFREAVLVMANNARSSCRVYAGWTSIAMNQNGLRDAWSLTDEELRTLINITGNERSIFGLDFPYKGIEQAKQAIARIKGLDIPDEAKTGILGQNLARELGIEL